MIRENVRLANSNKMMSLVQSSINHEMLTPIKCIIQTVSTFKHNFREPHFDKDANLVICTAQMLQNQVKGNLDRNLLEQNEFTPQLGFVYLQEMVESVLFMFKTEAEQLKLLLKANFRTPNVRLKLDSLRIN